MLALPTELTNLPADLAAFLSAGRALEFDPCANGSTVAKPVPASELAVQSLEIKLFAPDSFGMHPDSVEVPLGPVIAIEVATICEGDYGDFRRLFWLPDVQRFAFYEGTPDSLRVFAERITWSVIASKPRWHLDGTAGGALHRAAPVTTENSRPQAALSLVRPIRRWRPWLLWNLALAVIAFWVWICISSPPPAISLTSYERIEIGMAEPEVHAIVRARPGYYRCCLLNPYGYDWHNLKTGNESDAVKWQGWGHQDGTLDIGYDSAGRVCCKKLNCRIESTLRPEEWSWWHRLTHRTIPERGGPVVIYTVF